MQGHARAGAKRTPPARQLGYEHYRPACSKTFSRRAKIIRATANRKSHPTRRRVCMVNVLLRLPKYQYAVHSSCFLPETQPRPKSGASFFPGSPARRYHPASPFAPTRYHQTNKDAGQFEPPVYWSALRRGSIDCSDPASVGRPQRAAHPDCQNYGRLSVPATGGWCEMRIAPPASWRGPRPAPQLQRDNSESASFRSLCYLLFGQTTPQIRTRASVRTREN